MDSSVRTASASSTPASAQRSASPSQSSCSSLHSFIWVSCFFRLRYLPALRVRGYAWRTFFGFIPAHGFSSHLPFATHSAPPDVLPASLLLASPPSRLGHAGFQFPHSASSARSKQRQHSERQQTAHVACFSVGTSRFCRRGRPISGALVPPISIGTLACSRILCWCQPT